LAAPDTICTPFVGRTIKGWIVKVRICITVTAAEAASAGFGNDILGENAVLVGLINALSNVTYHVLGTAVETDYLYGASDNYDDAEDSAVFSFVTTQGTVAKISIPAPKSTIFLADNQTVNPANAAVAAFVTELLTPSDYAAGSIASAKSGAAFVSFLGALRVRKRTRRKLNIFVKNPQLTTTGV
jgi:hypothetical protein